MMEIIIESTKIFEKNISKVSNKQILIDKINMLIEKLKHYDFNCSKLENIAIKKITIFNEIESNIYTYKISNEYRVIFAIDIDPLFNQTTITLYSLIKPDSYQKCIKSIAESLRQQLGVQDEN